MTLPSFSQRPSACVVIIGHEILSGRTQDQNLAYIAQGLLNKGIALQEARVVQDDLEEIAHTLREARARFQVLITTGGLGSTHDDVTTAAVAQAIGQPLIHHPEAWRMMEQHYGTTLDLVYQKMACLPHGAVLIPNHVTGAPGFSIHNIHVLAGVPVIMRAMFDALLPRLPQGRPWYTQTVTCRVEEGLIAQDLEAIQARYPDVQIGSYPVYGAETSYSLSLVLKAESAARLQDALHACTALIQKHGGVPILGSEQA